MRRLNPDELPYVSIAVSQISITGCRSTGLQCAAECKSRADSAPAGLRQYSLALARISPRRTIDDLVIHLIADAARNIAS